MTVWTFALNLIVNSFLSFVTGVILIQLLLMLRMRSARIEAFLLCIPLLKLAIDPFLYDFGNWALLQQVNPLEQPPGTRMLSVLVWFPGSAITFSIESGQTFTLADIAAMMLPQALLKGIVLFTGGISLLLASLWCCRMVRAKKELSLWLQRAKPCFRPVQNPRLLAKIKGVPLLLSDDIEGPCAYAGRICFPTQLIGRLTQEEFEAIMAHELEHLRFFDGAVRLLSAFLSKLFWWVPAGLWLKALEQRQERACDEKVSRYQISPLALASAILKAAREARMPPLLTGFAAKGALVKRLMPLIEETRTARLKWLKVALAAMGAVSITLGKFWIF